MCGIVGVLGKTNRDVFDGMLKQITHRGPDESGQFLDRNAEIMMGTQRLSIIDVDGGKQPIVNEDGTVVVTFNGEIYNYRDLRESLRSDGHRFVTDCDTEVLVHLWEEEGKSMVHHLEGMYAFAIWDSNRDSVFLARDPLGIKPLYVSTAGDQVVWASEITPLVIAGVDSGIDQQAVYNYFHFRFTPWPQTLLSSVQNVEPGTSLLIENDDISRHRFWNVPTETSAVSRGQAAKRIRSTLETAVRRRLVSDVPLGAFLSGGLDSSAIVALMSEFRSDPVQTFSIGFQGDQYDESDEARMVADHFGTDHHEQVVDLDLMDIFGDLATQLGEPLGDPALLPTTALSRHARDSVKVALTGEGADELFGGYWYYDSVPEHRQIADMLPSAVFELLSRVGSMDPPKSKYFQYGGSLSSDQQIALTLTRKFTADPDEYVTVTPDGGEPSPTDIITECLDEHEVAEAVNVFDIEHALSDGLLYKVDQASMSTSLEARVPFLDTELVELALSIPIEDRVDGRYKPLLRKAMEDLLPEQTMQREKHGFHVPIERWFRTTPDSIERWLTEERISAAPYVSPDRIFELWSAHRKERTNNADTLWKVLNYVAWYDHIESLR